MVVVEPREPVLAVMVADTRCVRRACPELVPYIARALSLLLFSILVLGHVLSPVRSLPRHSLLLIANYTSEHVCWLRPSAIFGNPILSRGLLRVITFFECNRYLPSS